MDSESEEDARCGVRGFGNAVASRFWVFLLAGRRRCRLGAELARFGLLAHLF